MCDTPVGLRLPGEPEREPGGGESGGSGPGGSGPGQPTPPDPMAMFGNPQEFADALRQFADLMSWQGGPVNWDLATNVARHTVAAQGDARILAPQSAGIAQALQLCDLWLDGLPTFPAGVPAIKASGRSRWVAA